MDISLMGRRLPLALLVLLALMVLSTAAWLSLPSPALAQEPEPGQGQGAGQSQAAAGTGGNVPRISETMQVTATRVPEDVEQVPASVTVITGEEIRARGATDLATALSTVAGLAVAPGGDAGAASSIPEIWGLREFDAFLLVVDGVPWGGAFNPALSTLDLTDVDRIEVLRGSAPVMFGATSFVGVIQVIHRQAGQAGGSVSAWGGSYGSGGGAASAPLPAVGSYRQSLTVDGERQGFSQDRTGWGRGHLLYRGSLATAGGGTFHVDFDDAIVDQKPFSPTPLVGGVLTPLVPIDSNQNPLHDKIDVNREQLNLGYDQKLGAGTWSTLVSGAHTNQTVGRGFLENVTGDNPDDHGIRQHLTLDDFYFDTHLAFDLDRTLRLITGIDELYGKAHNASSDWDYFQNVNGSNPPDINSFSPFGATDLHDTRSFAGLYAQGEWTPTRRWRLQLGARLNHTHESLVATSVNFPMPAAPAGAPGAAPSLGSSAAVGASPAGAPGGLLVPQPKDVSVGPGSATRNVTRGGGAAGLSYLAWEGTDGAIWAYGDYRNTFKPAALDFGPDVNGVILKPETAQSFELGLKGRHLGGRFDWELSLFQMDFSNLVVGQVDAFGNPELVNAGNERFKGVEVEADYLLAGNLRLEGVYSYHDAKYTNYVALSDAGVLEQLAGNRLPLSAHDMGAVGFIYSPASGFTGWATINYTGSRFLDPENTALAGSFAAWAAGIGYRYAAWEVRLDGWNLSDSRAPIAASEFGPSQYYRMNGRSLRGTLVFRFK
ncbi:MAG: TonB-dependent receptor [Acidobacteria bacterium]|nr:TonB-dependent receptor [Acidobacteriota bacterium]